MGSWSDIFNLKITIIEKGMFRRKNFRSRNEYEYLLVFVMSKHVFLSILLRSYRSCGWMWSQVRKRIILSLISSISLPLSPFALNHGHVCLKETETKKNENLHPTTIFTRVSLRYKVGKLFPWKIITQMMMSSLLTFEKFLKLHIKFLQFSL